MGPSVRGVGEQDIEIVPDHHGAPRHHQLARDHPLNDDLDVHPVDQRAVIRHLGPHRDLPLGVNRWVDRGDLSGILLPLVSERPDLDRQADGKEGIFRLHDREIHVKGPVVYYRAERIRSGILVMTAKFHISHTPAERGSQYRPGDVVTRFGQTVQRRGIARPHPGRGHQVFRHGCGVPGGITLASEKVVHVDLSLLKGDVR